MNLTAAGGPGPNTVLIPSYGVTKSHGAFPLELAVDKDETTIGTIGTAGIKVGVGTGSERAHCERDPNDSLARASAESRAH